MSHFIVFLCIICTVSSQTVSAKKSEDSMNLVGTLYTVYDFSRNSHYYDIDKDSESVTVNEPAIDILGYVPVYNGTLPTLEVGNCKDLMQMMVLLRRDDENPVTFIQSATVPHLSLTDDKWTVVDFFFCMSSKNKCGATRRLLGWESKLSVEDGVKTDYFYSSDTEEQDDLRKHASSTYNIYKQMPNYPHCYIWEAREVVPNLF